MATPLKPWERARQRSLPSGGTPEKLSDDPQGQQGYRAPPPPTVPPRPLTSFNTTGSGTAYGAYTPYVSYSPMSRYSSYGYQPYGAGYGQYGTYSGAGYGGGYGGVLQQAPPPTFVRQAEERSRVAFQSVEAVVGAVASVSMMLESTYFAVQSCFRALLGVVHHFDGLRSQLWRVLGGFALLRRFRLFLLRLLARLRLRRATVAAGDAWGEVVFQQQQQQQNQQPQVQVSAGLWPILAFFGVVFGIPWLLWKLISLVVQSDDQPEQQQQRGWSQQLGEGQVVARALYSYQASRSDELSFVAGDELTVAPQSLQPQLPGWILAGINRQSGLVPANYVEIVPPGRVGGAGGGQKMQGGGGGERREGITRNPMDEESNMTD